ncbi:uncharacterized protein LOC124460833 [Drosophila willistoni]|uniref:uncharacterized protein LOC124460833 n=1 Tax=Drosophila willistoni TaxID=7260 RepID=UPI001F071C36|nr:uncharacterized protein LOC124460833 [Drosophila willistoni]
MRMSFESVSRKADASTQTETEPNGQAAIMAELAIVKKALGIQTALMRHMAMAMGKTNSEVRRVCFPLESVLQIVDLKEQITSERSKNYTSQVSALLGQAALQKSIKNFSPKL